MANLTFQFIKDFYRITPLSVFESADFLVLCVAKPLPKHKLEHIVEASRKDVLVLIKASILGLIKQFLSASKVPTSEIREGPDVIIVHIPNKCFRRVLGRRKMRLEAFRNILVSLGFTQRIYLKSLQSSVPCLPESRGK